MPPQNSPTGQQKILLKTEKYAFLGHIAVQNPTVSAKIVENLPIEGVAQRWGEEIYFFVDLAISNGHAILEAEEGDIAYWPEGPAIAIFFGRTPVSTGSKPKAYSPVSVFAHLDKIEKEKLNAVKDGERIVLELAKE